MSKVLPGVSIRAMSWDLLPLGPPLDLGSFGFLVAGGSITGVVDLTVRN